ncbi:aquaporin-12-like [Protopterus annectens]|uniref:aquaporin-12-like n=1 Tax=Protopterus annectens TaxID=7888 RepID=UPI001CFAE51E|nr:aquaporin-12-like [Protopterus annectens]
MAGLNVSFCFFLAILIVCEATRRLSKRFLPTILHSSLIAELACAFQLCSCCFELRMLADIGPWGGGFGMDVTMTLLFLLFLIHGVTFGGASANPVVSLQEFLLLEASFRATVLKLLAQFAGTELARASSKYFLSFELTELHMIQNMMAIDCSSSNQTSVYHGSFVEGVCAALFCFVIMRFQYSHFLYRIPVMALTVTTLAYTAGSYTAAFFNPALAYSVTFHCSGNTTQEYMIVYWLGPFVGMLVALFLYNGKIPRLFQKNMLYSEKAKYKIPKGKSVQGSADSKSKTQQNVSGKNNSTMPESASTKSESVKKAEKCE